MTSSSSQVLIVGSGPTGLLLAAHLLQHNVAVRLIDKRTKPRPTSRAFTVHARTIELLDTIGAANAFVNNGIHNNGFIFNFKGKSASPKLDFSKLKTPYPYVLIIKQNNTEDTLRKILHERFGVVPEWGTKLVSLESNADGTKVIIEKRSDISDEPERLTLNPIWVVGCDGAYSTVRDAIDVEFAGKKYEKLAFEMMDTKIDSFDGDPNWLHYYMSKESFVLMCKLYGDDNHRILVSRMSDSVDRATSQHKQFQRLVDSHVSGALLSDPVWATRWELWKKLAVSYRKDSVFIAGDAAHVHSPAGGQGMNVGLQDSFNLGWKLAFVVKGYAKPSLLNTYEKERKPIGEQVISGTDAMHDIIMAHGKGVQERMRLTKMPGWHDDAVRRISGLSYNYRDATEPSILRLADQSNPKLLQPGDRVPPALGISASQTLADLLRFNTKLLFLLLGSEADGERTKSQIMDSFGDFSSVHTIDTPEFGFEDGFAYVIRPDGYLLTYFCIESTNESLSLLEQWFIAKDNDIEYSAGV